MHDPAPGPPPWELVPRRRHCTFSPPASWPTPPAGWRPWSGWAPQPEWPVAPADHVWWVRTPADRRARRRARLGIVLGSLAVLGGCAGFVAVASADNGCGFDPPPGDYADYVVQNDTSSPVTLVTCEDARCHRADAEDAPVVEPGRRSSVMLETCAGDPVGVVRGSTPVAPVERCVQIPVDDDPPRRVYLVSQAPACG